MAEKFNTSLTADRLRELLDYDPESGIFTTRKTGKVAGYQIRGYTRIVLGPHFYAHRLAWLYVHGKWPRLYIDHINGDRSDNRISNLRECNNVENGQNVRRRGTGRSGILGVDYAKREGRWRANIRVNGKSRSLGYYDTPEEAGLAYQKARAELHPFAPEVGRK